MENNKGIPEQQENSGIIRDEKGRFPKGVSGNPAGRPKFTLTGIIKEKLQEVPEGEQKTYAILLIENILQKAIKDGDHKTQKLVWNYIEGMPRQNIGLDGGDEDKPIGVSFLDPDVRKLIVEVEEKIKEQYEK